MLAQHVAEHRLRRPLRNHSPLREHGERVAQPLGLLHVMRGEHDAQSLGAQGVHEVPHRHARVGIEARGRLVQEQEPRPVHQRTREHEPPPEAARQRLGLGAGVRRQGEALQQLVHALAHVERPRPEVARRDGQIFANREVSVERVLLRADAELSLEAHHVARRIHPVEPDDTGVCAQKAVEHAQRGGLARAVGTKEAQHLPGVADEVHPIHDGPSTEMLPQTARLEECRHVGHCIGPADRRRHPLPGNLRFDELRKKGERFLPAEIAGLRRDGLRYPFLHDVDFSTDGHLPQRYRRLHLSG